MKKTAIVIPTYNEKENISRLIREIINLKIPLEIIVVDDNSPDKTYEEVEKLKTNFHNLHLIKRPSKLGLGTAHITGFTYAEKELNSNYVITMDADFSHNPNDIPKIIEALKENDVVIGSRYTDGGIVVDSPFLRRLISKTANFLTTYLLKLKVKDATSGFRGYRIDALRMIDYSNIFSDGYSFLVEIIYKISLFNGVKIKEVPITFIDRKHGKSKISRKEIFKAIETIITLFLIKFFLRNKFFELIDKRYIGLNFINHIRLKFHTSRYKKVKELLKDGSLIDIGCGRPAEFMNDMAFLIYLNRKNSYGIDIKEIENPRYEFKRASVYKIPYPDKSFDNITMMEVIEHIEDIDKAFMEINRILKHNGKLIIVTPDSNIFWKTIWFFWSVSFGKIWKDTHISNYTKKFWIKIISRYFDIISIKRSWYFDLIFECRKK